MAAGLSRSVQFRTADDVLTAFGHRKVCKFAIFADRQFIHRYQGNDFEEAEQQLTQLLEMLQANGSPAIYSLCFYEDLPKGAKITAKTDYDGSFNFRLQDNHLSGLVNPPARYDPGLKEEIKELRQLVLSLKEDQELDEQETQEEPGKKTIGEMLLAQIEPILPQIAQGLINKFLPGQVPGQELKSAMISGLHSGAFSEVDERRLIKAAEIMREKTPDIISLLEKFAALSKNNPVIYSIAISKIKDL